MRTLDADNSVYKTRTLLLFGHYIQMLSEEIEANQYHRSVPAQHPPDV